MSKFKVGDIVEECRKNTPAKYVVNSIFKNSCNIEVIDVWRILENGFGLVDHLFVENELELVDQDKETKMDIKAEMEKVKEVVIERGKKYDDLLKKIKELEDLLVKTKYDTEEARKSLYASSVMLENFSQALEAERKLNLLTEKLKEHLKNLKDGKA